MIGIQCSEETRKKYQEYLLMLPRYKTAEIFILEAIEAHKKIYSQEKE